MDHNTSQITDNSLLIISLIFPPEAPTLSLKLIICTNYCKMEKIPKKVCFPEPKTTVSRLTYISHLIIGMVMLGTNEYRIEKIRV